MHRGVVFVKAASDFTKKCFFPQGMGQPFSGFSGAVVLRGAMSGKKKRRLMKRSQHDVLSLTCLLFEFKGCPEFKVKQGFWMRSSLWERFSLIVWPTGLSEKL